MAIKGVERADWRHGGLKAAEGQPYSAKKVDEDRNQISPSIYAWAISMRTFARPLTRWKGTPSARGHLHIAEGPRVIICSVATLGARATRQSLIDQTVRLKPEVPLREDEMFSAESRLYSLGIFDWAEIDPRRQITTQNQEDVLVKVHESKKTKSDTASGSK